MSENKDEILADFQNITGIEDVVEALGHLEKSKWDLLEAINRVTPQETQTLPSEQSMDVEMIEDIRPNENHMPVLNGGGRSCMSIAEDYSPLPSTSLGRNSSTRLLLFCISYEEHIIQVQLTDGSTVANLKEAINVETLIPVCQQNITGWKIPPTSDSCVLSTLNLPRENMLFLSRHQDLNHINTESRIAKLLQTKFVLAIHDEYSNKSLKLPFDGTKSIGEVKAATADVTNIAVRNQVWTGWPKNDDKCLLAQADLDLPEHKLTVNHKKEKKNVVVDLVDDSDSSVEEFEDASESFNQDDEMFVEDELPSKRPNPLIPDNVEDETAGCLHFNDGFTNHYGALHPEFFPGTLEEAINEACMKPAKDRKLLAVYLHHDRSVLTNVFCTQLLCFESVLDYLHNNFVVWGWDLTFASNKNKFLSSMTANLGAMAAMTVRNIPVDRMPVIIIIMKTRSNNEIFTIINGNLSINELLSSLIQAVDVFRDQQHLEIKEEEERTAREMIKNEQDQAYQASLEIDRAKEAAKQQQILLENQEKIRLELEKREVEAKKLAERQMLEMHLPKEPSENSNGITKIRFRITGQENFERRFLATNKLQDLLNYLCVAGYHTNDYKVISSWPRRDLTTLDVSATLEELKLCPQETLILEER